jgi:DNA (cytosine-5)-methyltransferase 1
MLKKIDWPSNGPYVDAHPASHTQGKQKAYCWLGSDDTGTFVDLFCGAGGMSIGFERAGFKPVLALDKDEDSIETYKYNRPNSRLILANSSTSQLINSLADCSLKNRPVKNPTAVIGGPPCQSFSTANRQRTLNDSRDSLYKEFIEIIRILDPLVAVMENVCGILNYEKSIKKDFQKINFEGNHYLINAKELGVPQNRKRVFFVFFNTKVFTSKEIVKKLTHLRLDIDRETKDVCRFVLKDALKNLPVLKAKNRKGCPLLETEESGKLKCYWHNNEITPFDEFINGSKTKSEFIYNHLARYNNSRDQEIFKRLPMGGNSLHPSISDLMPYKSRNNIFKDKYYKLSEDDVCKTITSHMKFDCNMYIHPSQARGLTPREAARIQCFPDSYIFQGSLGSMFRQIGNAVPPPVAFALAKSIKKIIS